MKIAKVTGPTEGAYSAPLPGNPLRWSKTILWLEKAPLKTANRHLALADLAEKIGKLASPDKTIALCATARQALAAYDDYKKQPALKDASERVVDEMLAVLKTAPRYNKELLVALQTALSTTVAFVNFSLVAETFDKGALARQTGELEEAAGWLSTLSDDLRLRNYAEMIESLEGYTSALRAT